MKEVSTVILILCLWIPALLPAQCPAGNAQKSLVIEWHYTECLSENPCERCRTGPHEVQVAYTKIEPALAMFDIKVALKKKTEGHEGDNLMINGKGLDHWLGGKLVKHSCASCLSTSHSEKAYYALDLEGVVHEVITADMIIRASLLAAAELFAGESAPPCDTKTPCQGCPGKH